MSNLPPKGQYPDRTLGERWLMAKGARHAAMIAEEHRHATRWYYLSFADGTGFLGAVIDLRNRLLSEDEVRGTLEGRRMRV